MRSSPSHARGTGGARRSALTVLLHAGAALALVVGTAGDADAADAADPGKRVYVKANCVGCHKWHGDGGGGYGGAALSLRKTALDRDQIVEIVRCGRPSTGMPYHARDAYGAVECYGGMAKADLGHDAPPTPKTFLRPEEVEAVADYVLAHLKGKEGAPTKDDCVAFWGAASRECQAMQ
jgi:mono/diheme cytochrome c family protein